jgi:valyl-tRNA synthetase
LELIKTRLSSNDPEAKKTALIVATYVMKSAVKLLHPFAPFISEAIWRGVTAESGLGLGLHESEGIMISNWPEPFPNFENERAESDFALLQEMIGAIRNLRSEMNIPAGKTAEVLVAGGDGHDPSIIMQHEHYFKLLARVHSITYDRNLSRPKLAAATVVKAFEVYLPLADLIDQRVERNRLEKERRRLEELLEELDRRLHSQDFLNKAPRQVVAREQQKKVEFETNLEKILTSLEQLGD